MEAPGQDRFDLEQRRAEVAAWFSHGPGGIAVAAVPVVLVILLILEALRGI